MRYVCLVAAFVTIAVLCGCSKHKALSEDELRSELLSADSYATEAEMFIDYVRQGHATRRFAEEHALQLSNEIGHSEKELNSKSVQPPDVQLFNDCKAQFEFLRRELPLIPALMGSDHALQTEHAKIAASRQRLAEAGSSL